MRRSKTIIGLAGHASGIALLFLVSLLQAAPAKAQSSLLCSDFGGVLDGDAGDVAPSQIQVDQNCTIRNFPADNPLDTNFSFYTQPGQEDDRWLIVFDNVVHTGQMSCNSVLEHKIWFTNGSSTAIQEGCQNLLIPVEKIDKANPDGRTTATVGVPFTYTLTLPVLFDAGTGTVINNAGSLNELHSVILTDDLNETGADLSYVSHTARWLSSGLDADHTFSNVGGLLTFDFDLLPTIPAGEQIIIELTVVLDNSPANVNGTSFFNTAKWQFGRLIEGVFYEPLPGEWGISPPMTIAGPDLTVTKTGPIFLNLGEVGDFTLNVQNVGDFEAWNVTLLDELPNVNGPSSGGMCDATPTITSAQVFEADGVTPASGPLAVGPDIAVTYSSAPLCELEIEVLSAAGTIEPGQRLIVVYQTELDADTANGLSLTNVAGAVEWFNGNPGVGGRQRFTRTLSDGTPGTLDHEDDHTVTAALFGSYFNKTVANVTTGGSGATAAPGDTLRYSLRLRTTDSPMTDVRIVDDLGVLNGVPVFDPGSLSLDLTTVPAGADTTNTDPTGGTGGAGLIDISGFDLPVDGEIVIQFEVDLLPVIANGTYARNQSALTAAGGVTGLSDDPRINGQASPDIDGDEDPTEVLILSAPEFQIEKVSSYLDGDPTRLMAGERLRYTISVVNIGTDEATDATIRDQIPANTSYVAGSTTLNGIAVPDPSAGVSPLSSGIPISPPGGQPGVMPADADALPSSTATIVFDVLVDPNVIDGTIVSNQAFIDAPDAGIANIPSDDPRTPIEDDPTRDIVGNFPLIYAEKSAVLETDFGTPGVVDPGDTLRYTITVYNNGPIDATDATLTDNVPSNTTYVGGSTTLNGLAVADPSADVSPLIDGLPVSTSDRTPPVPGAGQGVLSPGESAVIEFQVLVDAGLAPGTLIVNQALVTTMELPSVPTDGDGNPATGPEPTVVVVGPSQQLSITKQIAVVGGGAALPGSTVEYTVRVANIGTVPATLVTIQDDLDVPVAGQLGYVAGSAVMNGSSNGVTFAGSALTADYAAEYGNLQPGEEIILRFEAVIDANLAIDTVVTNVAEVNWNDTPETATASVSVTLGGAPGVGALNGGVWHDVDFDDQRDAGERVFEGWTVQLYRQGTLLHTTVTDVDGNYRIAGVAPTLDPADRYQLRFLAPGAGANTAALGRAFSDFTNGLQSISDIDVTSGSNLVNLDLPLDPNGVVYNTVARSPVPGAVLTMLDAVTGTPLPEACFEDEVQQGQVTLANGFYKFDIDFSEPACPEGIAYLIEVTPPSASYISGPSTLIPPTTSAATAALILPDCLQGGAADAIPTTTNYCEASALAGAPGPSVPTGSPQTTYYLHLTLDNSNDPGSRQIFNNHIPLDPDLADSVSITKTSPALSVTRGELVPYVITVTNDAGFDLTEVNIIDRFPVGFSYVDGSARIDRVPTEPQVIGQELVWSNLAFTGAGQHRIELLLAVGAGVSEGDFVNRAQVVHGATGDTMSNVATATVRLVPDPNFDCTDVMGKVYEDRDRNGQQDIDEPGLAGVRLVSTAGLSATTDSYGRYHITCAVIPNESRGSNFVLKLDDRTLPSGYRASIQPVRIERATRGKTLRMNFGASIHRVVGLDIADPVFVPDGTELRPQWEPRIGLLLEQLAVAPAVLRLTYLADIEDPDLVEDRIDALETMIETLWSEQSSYRLEIEAEIFWRLGGPPDLPDDGGNGR